MPTPLAHAIAGIAAGWLAAGRPRFVDGRHMPGGARSLAVEAGTASGHERSSAREQHDLRTEEPGGQKRAVAGESDSPTTAPRITAAWTAWAGTKARAGEETGERTTRLIRIGRLGTIGGDTLLFAALGMLPDVDFLWGMHNMHTHSIGATLLAGLVVVLLVHRHRARLGLAAMAAYGSHVLLDWLGTDTTPPIGIMALWPFSDGYYLSDLQVFLGVMRRLEHPIVLRHNLTAVAWELVILVPILGLVWTMSRRRSSTPW
jgi:hypothetical protein